MLSYCATRLYIICLQAATILNPSLRMLHVDNQMPWEKPFVPAVQWVLRETEPIRHINKTNQ